MSQQTIWPTIAALALACATAGCHHESVASTAQPPSKAAAAAVPKPIATPAAGAQPAAELATEPAAKPQPQRPPADRIPARPGEAEKITFDDLNLGMAADMVFRPFLINDRVQELDGKRLSLLGYMHGGVESRKNIKEFVLLKNTECKFGPGGQADHLAQVFLKPGAETVFTQKPVKVEATLKIQPMEGVDGNTWSIYRLEDAKVVP